MTVLHVLTGRRHFLARAARSLAVLTIGLPGRLVFGGPRNPFGVEPPPPRTLRQAIVSSDRKLLARFIARNPALAPKISRGERIEALKRLAQAEGAAPNWSLGQPPPGVGKGKDPWTCLECQQAAAILLEPVAEKPEELRSIMEALGGPKWLQRALPGYRNAQLRSIAIQALRLGES